MIGRMLHPHRVRVFRSVVASGSVQAAADNLGLTSSAVSQHLAALQKETGLTLFQRVDGYRADRGRSGPRRPDDAVMSQRGRSTRSPPTCATAARDACRTLLLLGRCGVDAVPRQAADGRVPRPRARARCSPRWSSGGRPSTSTCHRPPGPRTGGRLPADRADRGPVRRDRAARPPPGAWRDHRPGRPARRDLGQQRLPALPRPPPGRGGVQCRRLPPPLQRAGPGRLHRRSGSSAAGSGCPCCPDWRRQPPATVVRLGPRRRRPRCVTWRPSCATSGGPTPRPTGPWRC